MPSGCLAHWMSTCLDGMPHVSSLIEQRGHTKCGGIITHNHLKMSFAVRCNVSKNNLGSADCLELIRSLNISQRLTSG